MKKLAIHNLIICFVFLLMGCSNSLNTDKMSNEQIIEKTNECEKAGLKAEVARNHLDGGYIVEIQCAPKSKRYE